MGAERAKQHSPSLTARSPLVIVSAYLQLTIQFC